MRTSAFASRCRRIASRCARLARATRRVFSSCACGCARLDDRTVRELPELLRSGDQLVVNDTKVIAASLRGRRIGRGAEPKIEATLIERLDGSRRALIKGAKSTPGDVVRFGDEGKVCFLGQLDATVETKREAGEVTSRFRVSRAGARSGHRRTGRQCRCRRTSPSSSPTGPAGPQRPPDHVSA